MIGIGADGLTGLGARSRAALAAAEVLVGGTRHLAMVPEDGRPRLPWRSPLAHTLSDLMALRGRPVAVLATGDPLWFGVASLLLRQLPSEDVRVLPHVSVFQEAAARLGWSLESTVMVSTHGRPIDVLGRHLAPGRRLIVLVDDGRAPGAIAAWLSWAGYGASRLWVLEELGSTDERILASRVDRLAQGRFADLTTIALELEADPGHEPFGVGTVLPDRAFAHDGQLTKEEVRAITLASLAPQPGELLWDVGAGSGSIAIEWLRADPSLRAVAIEHEPERMTRILENAGRLGAQGLVVHPQRAPAGLDRLPQPDAIFIGGGVGQPGLLDACWAYLRPGGRLVANAVTLAGEAALLACHARHGGRLVRIALSRAEPLGGEVAWRPALPVTHLAVRKPCAAAS